MSDYKWRRLEETLGVDVKKPTRGIELPILDSKETTTQKIETQKPKISIPKRKAIKADDPYL
jgi:hypothetical protein